MIEMLLILAAVKYRDAFWPQPRARDPLDDALAPYAGLLHRFPEDDAPPPPRERPTLRLVKKD